MDAKFKTSAQKSLKEKDQHIVALFNEAIQTFDEISKEVSEVQPSVKWGMPHYDCEGFMCGIGASKNHRSI